MLRSPRAGTQMAGFKNFGDFDAVGLADLFAKNRRRRQSFWMRRSNACRRSILSINAVPIRHEEFARRQIERGLPDGPFRGVPFVLKDLTLLEGTETHYGSRAFKTIRPTIQHARRALSQRRADDIRQDEYARTRSQLHDGARRARADAQSMESWPTRRAALRAARRRSSRRASCRSPTPPMAAVRSGFRRHAAESSV